MFVISDLHLGGEPGFQMCGDEGPRLLAGFVRWVTAQHRAERAAHVVIAGDADVFRYREGAALDAMRLPDGPVDF